MRAPRRFLKKGNAARLVDEKQRDFAVSASAPEWIVVVTGVLPQVRGYRSKGGGEGKI